MKQRLAQDPALLLPRRKDFRKRDRVFCQCPSCAGCKKIERYKADLHLEQQTPDPETTGNHTFVLIDDPDTASLDSTVMPDDELKGFFGSDSETEREIDSEDERAHSDEESEEQASSSFAKVAAHVVDPCLDKIEHDKPCAAPPAPPSPPVSKSLSSLSDNALACLLKWVELKIVSNMADNHFKRVLQNIQELNFRNETHFPKNWRQTL